jgi:exodeoxyribonuclease VII small subunit
METSLEESLSLFEEGMRLSKALEKTLSEAKRKVEVILSEDLTEAETTVLE